MKNMIKRISTYLLAIMVAVLVPVINVSAAEVAAVNVSNTTPEPTSVAFIVVEGYEIEGGMLTPGGQVTLNLKLHNLSNSMAAGNVMLTLYSNDGMVFPVYGQDNQVYVGNIGADKTETVAVPISVSNLFRNEVASVNCDIQFIVGGSKVSNTATLAIPAAGGAELGVRSVEVSSHAVVGGQSLVSVSFVNQSKESITDAKLTVTGNVTKDSSEIDLGIVGANKILLKDYSVVFTESGVQEINVALSYTDSNGNEQVDELGTYTVTVSKDQIEEVSELPKAVVLAGKAVAALIAVVALGAIVIYAKRR